MKLKLPLIISVSNGKGGVGKTTYCMHLISAFLVNGFKVFSMDLDYKQKSLSIYLENRRRYIENNPKDKVITTKNYVLSESKKNNVEEIQAEEQQSFIEAVEGAKSEGYEVIIIDTPGDFSHRSILAHRIADIVITPINDSFIDLSVLGSIDENLKIHGPSVYSNISWDQKMQRVKNKMNSFEWFVVRNRLNSTDTLNKRKMNNAIQDLSKQLGFKIASGFSDRVIFKDLFLYGLTLLDIGKASAVKSFTPSNLAAKTEMREFLSSIKFEEILKIKSS